MCRSCTSRRSRRSPAPSWWPCATVTRSPCAAAETVRRPWFADHRELSRAGRPDVVHVCTPHDQHAPVAIDCLDAGVGVLLEKPVAHTVAEADRLIAAAAASIRRQDRDLPAEPVQRRRPGPPATCSTPASSARCWAARPPCSGTATRPTTGPGPGAGGWRDQRRRCADQPGHPHPGPDGVAARRRRAGQRPRRPVRAGRSRRRRGHRARCCSTTPAGARSVLFATVGQRRGLAGHHRDRHRAGDAAHPRRPDRQLRRRAGRDGRRAGGQPRRPGLLGRLARAAHRRLLPTLADPEPFWIAPHEGASRCA